MTDNGLFLEADENPAWVANRIARFLSEDPDPLPDVDLSQLEDKATLTVGFYGTLENAALGGSQDSQNATGALVGDNQLCTAV
jgi:hypothetical protein